VYLADVGWALVRRLRQGEQIGAAHRDHVYQRLVDAGWPHLVSAAVVAAGAAVIALAAALLGTTGAAAAAGVVLAGYLLLPRLLLRTRDTA
jgi:hypothetical protein